MKARAGALSIMTLRYGVAVVAVVAVVASVPAVAQTPPVAIPAKDFGPVWTGFYVGAAFGAGGAVNRLDTSGGGLAASFNGAGGSGVLGSIYGGVDYQITQRGVLGLLAELSYSGFQGGASAQVPGASANVNMNTGLGWAVLARAGVLANPSTLLYLVGGYAGQNIHTDGFATAPGAAASFSTDQTVNGWTIGPGFETGLMGNWTGKLEYRYSQFGRTTLAGSNIGLNPSNHAIRAGLSYRFGGLGVASSNEQAPRGPTNVNWTGIYGGAAAGAGMGFGRLNAVAGGPGGAAAGFDSGGQGLLGSVFAGADYQFSPARPLDLDLRGRRVQPAQCPWHGQLGSAGQHAIRLARHGAERFHGRTRHRNGDHRRLDDATGISLQSVRAEGSGARHHHAAVEPHDPRRSVLQVRHGARHQHRAGAGLSFFEAGDSTKGGHDNAFQEIRTCSRLRRRPGRRRRRGAARQYHLRAGDRPA